MWKITERTAWETRAGSGFAGNTRRPSLSGSNTARQLPLRANEVVGICLFGQILDKKGGTAYFTSLAVEILQGTFLLLILMRKAERKHYEDYVKGWLREGVWRKQKYL